jgi:hydroxymethylpyrimidine kinase/phosphomethylpyrimidine kinase
MRRPQVPIALTIAGSDSGGGAGVQADLKTFAALGVHGVCAITCVTAQNPRRVRALEPCSPKIVRAQIEAAFEELPPRAAKTGMLFSAKIIREVAQAFRGRRVPLVIDPVMIATSGARLFEADAMRALARELIPFAALITPNIPEAEALLNISIREPEHVRRAAREIYTRFGCMALVKGGHLRNASEAIDIFYDGKTELLLSTCRVRGVKTHGTGCAYSAAIVAHLARGEKLVRAVQLAKQFITAAIARSERAGRHDVLALLTALR